MAAQAIILFDGDCAFCNGWVNWIRKRDERDLFTYAPLASEEGQRLRAMHAIPASTDSVVLVEAGHAFLKSNAAGRILRSLPGYRLAGTMLLWVPRVLRDPVYDLVARNRHRLGMKDQCELPGNMGNAPSARDH